MKKYSAPETMSLQVKSHDIICASGGPAPAPSRSGSIGNMGSDNGGWY